MSTPATPLLRFGNYDVLQLPGGAPEELGRGGFGRTYRARHSFLGTEVAVKVIAEGLVRDATARTKFLKEAREHVRLDHPGIARILDFGDQEGMLYYVMELCRGGDLKDLVVRKGPLPAAEAMSLILQAAEALQHVHEGGILHLDIKPANLLTTPAADGTLRIKITDFGLVRRMAAGGGAAETCTPVSWSPAFASPEQIREETPDLRADIFSLGMTAWFLVSGRMAVEGSVSEVIVNRLQPAAYETSLPDSLTGEYRRIVCRMIEKDPARRYQSCAELIADLQSAAAPRTDDTTRPWAARPADETVVHLLQLAQVPVLQPLVRSGRKPILMALAGVLAVAAGTAAWLAFRHDEEPPAPVAKPPVASVPAAALPATIRLRGFQSRYPLPAGLTIGGRPGVMEGNTLVFAHAVAADGSFRMDSPRWELASRAVLVEGETYEAKLQLVTQPVTFQLPETGAAAWAAVLFTPVDAADLPDPAKLAPLLGAEEQDGGWRFALEFPNPKPVALPPGACRVTWLTAPDATGAPRSLTSAPLTVETGKPAVLLVPAGGK